MELEKQAVSFKKVYGDIFTTPQELQSNLDAIMSLGKEYTKYGIAVKDTVGLAAQAAAAGRTNKDLTDAVAQSTRLATLGQIDQNTALETTIALQSAFKLSGKELSDSINFLNMVENQTVVSLQDLSLAIPKVAPVIVGLGGNVQDLAVFLAAMQEGGVSAGEGANALKSGLASLINPTKAAKEMLGGFGINLEAIVNTNKGNLRGTVTEFATALQTLDEFSRQQALEQVFGKFQFARLGALFENIVREGSQAQQVMDATKYSTQDMARTADKELSIIENSFGVQLTGAIERLKLSLAPIGKLFIQIAIPIVNFITKIVDGFNNLPDFTKKFIAFATIITGLVIPAGTMFFGLLMNLSGTLAKLLQSVGLFSKGALTGGILGGIQAVSQSMKYMSLEEIDASIAAKQLGAATMTTNDAFRQQVLAAEGAKVAVMDLAGGYQYLINRMAEAAGLSKVTLGAPGAAMGIAKSRGIKGPKRFATGGVVPGTGNQDTVPAMLTPGEFVINKDGVKSVGASYLKQLNDGKINGYIDGTMADRRNAMANEQVKKGGKGLNAALKDPNSKITMSSGVIPGNPVIIKESQSLQLTHFTGRNPGKLIGPQGDYSSISNKLGSFAEQQQGFTALLPSTINQNLRNNAGGVNISTIIDYLKRTPAHRTFQPLDEVNAKLGIGSGSSIIQQQMIDRLEKLQKRKGDILLKDKDIGPMYRSIIKTRFPKTYSALKKPMQWRGDTSSIHSALGISGAKDLKNSNTINRLSQQGFTVLNNGIPLTAALRGKDAKDSFIKNSNIPKGNLGIYINKGGKVSIIDPATKAIVGASYTGGAKVPGLFHTISSMLITKGGSKVGLRKKLASGGVGGGPSLLTPGEFVVNKDVAAKNRPFLDALNAGKVKRFAGGTGPLGNYGGNQTERMNTAKQRLQNIKVANVTAPMSKVGGAAGAAAFPAMIAGPALQASSNELAQKMGSVVSSMTPVLFGMQLLGPVTKQLLTKFPALAGVTGGIVVGMAALGIATYKVIEQINKVRQSGAELTKAMYGSSKTVSDMANAFGRQSPVNQLTSLRSQKAGGAVSAQAQGAADQFMQTDIAKQMLKDIETVKKAGGDASIALRNQLTRSIMAGVISPEEARGVAISIGTALNDQKLSVDVSAKLTQLLGQDGQLIKGNMMQIYAEISPKFDPAEIKKTAEELYAQQTSGFMGTIGSLFDNKELELQKIAINDIGERTVQSAKMQQEAVAATTLAYENGTIAVDEYNKKIAGFQKVSGDSATAELKAIADQLGVRVEDLNKIKNETTTVAGNKFTPQTTSKTSRAKSISSEQDKLAGVAKESLKSAGLNDQITNDIISGLKNIEIQKSFKYLGIIGGGAISEEMALQIAMALGKPELVTQIKEAFKAMAPKIDPKTGLVITTGQYPDPTPPGPKSKIQELKDSAKETNNYSKAIQYLVKNGIKAEALANIDAATAIEIMNGKRKDLISLINNQASMQRVIANQIKSDQERNIDLINLEIDAIDSSIEADQRKLDSVNRVNELDQRRLNVRQHGLDLLSQKEAVVNKIYDDRVNALNKVREANTALAQQQQDRINLASALTSGDIAGAAQAASTMGANFASGQMQNAQAELDAQRQRELESLTVSINGQLMTRKQIEDSINVINEQMYQRNLNTLPIQDAIWAKEEQKKIKNSEINTINQQIFAEQVKQDAKLASQNAHLKDMVGYYKKVAYWINQAANKSYVEANTGGEIVKKAFGGMIKRYAFGGMAYGSKESPPPLKMALGSMVPGLGNTDRVPALLTPGEFVVKKSAAAANMGLLNSINSDVFPNISPSDVSVNPSQISSSNVVNNTPVYTYNVSVNVPSTDATPDQIANIVAQKMRKMSAGNMRGSRY